MCNFKPGDGIGGIETTEPRMSPEKCINHCIKQRKTNPNINGVTVDTGGYNHCYCEHNMKSWKTMSGFKSCKLPSRKLQLFLLIY